MGRAWGQLGRRARVFTAVSVLATLGVAASASSASALPRDFWGVVPQGTPSPEQLLRLKRGGVDSVRIPISWSAVQPRRDGGFDFSGTDSVIASAVEARLDVLPFLFEAPRWAVPPAFVPGSHRSVRAPRFLPVRNGVQRSGWRRFVIQAVRRYGPRGSFWREHPDLPKHPIRTWQIWNEPNFKYFVTRPNPVEYGKLVKLSYGAVKSVDRGARIVLGGLFSNPAEARIRRGPRQAYTAREFLQIMYRRTPGVRANFQGVALHPYAANYKRLVPYIEEVRGVLKANRDAGKGLWVTELGWSSEPPSREHDAFAKGLRGQAAQLRGAFRLLRARQHRWHLQGVYWFSVEDLADTCNFCGGSGLFGEGFRPKPAWNAYVHFAGGRP